jgi:hypothetical protein
MTLVLVGFTALLLFNVMVVGVVAACARVRDRRLRKASHGSRRSAA